MCLEGMCIDEEWLCDGTNDCPAADDESIRQCGEKWGFLGVWRGLERFWENLEGFGEVLGV